MATVDSFTASVALSDTPDEVVQDLASDIDHIEYWDFDAFESAAESLPPAEPRRGALPALDAESAPKAAFADRAPRHPKWAKRHVWSVALLDVLAAVAGVGLAMSTIGWSQPAMLIGAVVAWPLLIAASRGYLPGRIGVGSDELRSVFKALVTAAAVGGLVLAIDPTNSVRWLLAALPVIFATSLLARYVMRKLLHRRQSRGKDLRNALLVGSADSVVALARTFRSTPYSGVRAGMACLPGGIPDERLTEFGIAVVADLEHVRDAVLRYGVDAVAVATSSEEGYLRQLAWSLEDTGVELMVAPGLVEVAGPRLHVRPFVGMPLLHVEQPTFTGWKRAFKAVTDLVLAGIGIVLLAPVLTAVAIAIKLEDGGPVFFRQERIGKGGKPFRMWKFRSMVVDAEAKLSALKAKNEGAGPLFKMREDPRITRVGRIIRKHSIDELPQLINVLTGTMSLVGPRPPLQSEVDQYEDPAHRRLLVQPGVTGLWQVSGRSELSWEESVRLDLRYVENWTFTGDLLLIWKTVLTVFSGQGAF